MDAFVSPEIGEEFEVRIKYTAKEFESRRKKLTHCDQCGMNLKNAKDFTSGCYSMGCTAPFQKDGKIVYYERGKIEIVRNSAATATKT